MDWLLVWLLVCVLVAFTIEAMTGFGSIVIALSLAVVFIPLNEVLVTILPLSVLMTSFLIAKNWRHIDAGLFFKRITPFMVVGGLIGVVLKPMVPEAPLLLAFSLLVLWFSLTSLNPSSDAVELSSIRQKVQIVGAGVCHGAFASGGPLLVHALAGRGLPKASFRATLLLVWWSLNSLLVLQFALAGQYNAQTLSKIGYFIPVLVIAVLLGNRAFDKVNEVRFKRLIFQLLAVIAVLLMIKSAISMSGL